MRLLALFVGIVVTLAGAVALVDWRVDPLSEFYDPGGLRAAARGGCLLSDELLAGENYLRFKEDVFRLRPRRTAVVGSSRVLKIGSWPGETTFANLGLPSTSPASLLRLFRALPARPLTVYLGVELFWFNPSWRPIGFHESTLDRIRYLLSRSNLRRSLQIARDDPGLALHRRRMLHVGGRCVVGRFSPYIAWNADGSRVFSFELQPKGGYRPPRQTFTRDVETLRFGQYGHWHGFDRARLRQLDEALAVARAKGWRVVGFAPPDPTAYVRLFSTDPRIAPYWRDFARDVPALFRAHGFRWLDLRDVRSVPCAQTDFVDNGFHASGHCSMRIRADLDRAARATRPTP